MLIHFPFSEYFCYLQKYWNFMDKACISSLVKVIFGLMFLYLLDNYLGMELQCHRIVTQLNFIRNSFSNGLLHCIFLSTMFDHSQLRQNIANIWYHQWIKSVVWSIFFNLFTLLGINLYLTKILICIILMSKNIEHTVSHLLTISVK